MNEKMNDCQERLCSSNPSPNDPQCGIPAGFAAPTPEPIGEMRQFNVRRLNYGFIVDVECHTFAIEKKETLIKLLTMYIDNPALTEKLWFSNQLFIQ